MICEWCNTRRLKRSRDEALKSIGRTFDNEDCSTITGNATRVPFLSLSPLPVIPPRRTCWTIHQDLLPSSLFSFPAYTLPHDSHHPFSRKGGFFHTNIQSPSQPDPAAVAGVQYRFAVAVPCCSGVMYPIEEGRRMADRYPFCHKVFRTVYINNGAGTGSLPSPRLPRDCSRLLPHKHTQIHTSNQTDDSH